MKATSQESEPISGTKDESCPIPDLVCNLLSLEMGNGLADRLSECQVGKFAFNAFSLAEVVCGL